MDVEDFLQPKLRLFLSVDLVGSTAIKQSEKFPDELVSADASLDSLRADWITEIETLYRNFQHVLLQQWEITKSKLDDSLLSVAGDAPKFWKANGDELIYEKELKNSKDCIVAITSWLNSVQVYREKLKGKNTKLDVKAAAWVAGFPIMNTEVIIDRNVLILNSTDDPTYRSYELLARHYGGKTENLVKDYIGPSIDTGFRVAKEATPRQFMLSVEAAYILSMPSELDLKVQFGYSKRKSLKGVLSGKPYPMIWIDTQSENSLIKAEDVLTGHQSLRAGKIHRFCSEFIDDQEGQSYIIRPFIYGSKEPELQDLPRHYEERIRCINEAWQNEMKKFGIEHNSDKDNPDEPGTIGSTDGQASELFPSK